MGMDKKFDKSGDNLYFNLIDNACENAKELAAEMQSKNEKRNALAEKRKMMKAKSIPNQFVQGLSQGTKGMMDQAYQRRLPHQPSVSESCGYDGPSY